MQFKKLWRQNFSGSAQLAQTFSSFGSTKIRLGFGSIVFRLNFCSFGSGLGVLQCQAKLVWAQCTALIAREVCIALTYHLIGTRFQLDDISNVAR